MNYLNTFKNPFLLAMILLVTTFMISCNDDEEDMQVETELTLSQQTASLAVGSQLELVPRFGSIQLPQKNYEWTVSDPSVLSVEMNPDTYAGTVTAVGEGNATATISSTDGSLQASTVITTTLIRETEAILPETVRAFTLAETVVTPSFNNVDVPVREYTWSTQPQGVLTVTTDPVTFAATLQGIMPGTTTLTIASTDGVVMASTQVTVIDENDGILKVLAIGNSFSEDALEQYFWQIANAAGKEVMVGNMYIGGADLATHANNAMSDAGNYSYRVIDINGTRTVTSGVSLSDAVNDQEWDVISFQQASYFSGLYDTFVEPLPIVYNRVSDWNEYEHTDYVLHKTWAYAQNSTHSGFPNYDSDQMTMYNAIINAYNQADDLIPVVDVIPAGTAIQNGRTSYLGDGFTRDGFHLNDLGKYTAALTWFEEMFDESAVGNTYVPDGIGDFDIELAQNAAHAAVESPNEITVLEDFQDPGGSGVITAPLFINFSSTTNPDGWNAYSSHLDGTTIPNLIDQEGTFTGVTALTLERFRGINNSSGAPGTNTNLNMPDEVSRSNFYSHGRDWGSNPPIPQSVIEFSGFTSNDTYELCFFGSRDNVGDNRETVYTVNGSDSQSATLDAAQNSDNIVCISNVQADAEGKITLVVSMGDNNSSTNGFYYINAMRIQPN